MLILIEKHFTGKKKKIAKFKFQVNTLTNLWISTDDDIMILGGGWNGRKRKKLKEGEKEGGEKGEEKGETILYKNGFTLTWSKNIKLNRKKKLDYIFIF